MRPFFHICSIRFVDTRTVVLSPQFIELAEEQYAVVIFAENMNGPFLGIGATDGAAGFGAYNGP